MTRRRQRCPHHPAVSPGRFEGEPREPWDARDLDLEPTFPATGPSGHPCCGCQTGDVTGASRSVRAGPPTQARQPHTAVLNPHVPWARVSPCCQWEGKSRLGEGTPALNPHPGGNRTRLRPHGARRRARTARCGPGPCGPLPPRTPLSQFPCWPSTRSHAGWTGRCRPLPYSSKAAPPRRRATHHGGCERDVVDQRRRGGRHPEHQHDGGGQAPVLGDHLGGADRAAPRVTAAWSHTCPDTEAGAGTRPVTRPDTRGHRGPGAFPDTPASPGHGRGAVTSFPAAAHTATATWPWGLGPLPVTVHCRPWTGLHQGPTAEHGPCACGASVSSGISRPPGSAPLSV